MNRVKRIVVDTELLNSDELEGETLVAGTAPSEEGVIKTIDNLRLVISEEARAAVEDVFNLLKEQNADNLKLAGLIAQAQQAALLDLEVTYEPGDKVLDIEIDINSILQKRPSSRSVVERVGIRNNLVMLLNLIRKQISLQEERKYKYQGTIDEQNSRLEHLSALHNSLKPEEREKNEAEYLEACAPLEASISDRKGKKKAAEAKRKLLEDLKEQVLSEITSGNPTLAPFITPEVIDETTEDEENHTEDTKGSKKRKAKKQAGTESIKDILVSRFGLKKALAEIEDLDIFQTLKFQIAIDEYEPPVEVESESPHDYEQAMPASNPRKLGGPAVAAAVLIFSLGAVAIGVAKKDDSVDLNIPVQPYGSQNPEPTPEEILEAHMNSPEVQAALRFFEENPGQFILDLDLQEIRRARDLYNALLEQGHVIMPGPYSLIREVNIRTHFEALHPTYEVVDQYVDGDENVVRLTISYPENSDWNKTMEFRYSGGEISEMFYVLTQDRKNAILQGMYTHHGISTLEEFDQRLKQSLQVQGQRSLSQGIQIGETFSMHRDIAEIADPDNPGRYIIAEGTYVSTRYMEDRGMQEHIFSIKFPYLPELNHAMGLRIPVSSGTN